MAKDMMELISRFKFADQLMKDNIDLIAGKDLRERILDTYHECLRRMNEINDRLTEIVDPEEYRKMKQEARQWLS